MQERDLVSTLKHIPVKNCSADLGSRGCNIKNLLNFSLWFHGPELAGEIDQDVTESFCNVASAHPSDNSHSSLELFNRDNFFVAFRIVSNVRRFINACLLKTRTKEVVTRFSSLTKMNVMQWCIRFD